ncbi:MAG: transcriptional regulator [Firmicutes bacterium]|nr:transcriptional regulator [Bacillota bacterium]MBP2641335.1 transcriptional regulator [Bacillota bacterium]
MRLEQLKYLVEIYRSKSISLAAERTHISQPALSSAISKLEDELGVQLLKRTNQGVYPTETGELVIQKSIEVIEALQDIASIARVNSSDLQEDISLAVEINVNMAFMPKVFAEFKKHCPKANIFQKVGESNNILRDVKSGKADFGIIIGTDELVETKDVSTRELMHDNLVILTSRNNPWAKQKTITLAMALEQPIILYNSEYVTDCGISAILRKYGSINVSYRVDTIIMLEKLLLQDQDKNIAFVPSFVAGAYTDKNKGLIVRQIQDPPLDISIVLIWSKRHHLSSTEKELVKVIRSVFSEPIVPGKK